MSLNKVMLIGNVGRDPEVRYLEVNPGAAPGTAPKVASFTLATTERYRDRNGELRENTEWHNIVAWRQSADVAEKYIRKGTQIYVEGKLRTRSWIDAQGVKKFTTEVVVDTLQLLGRRPDGQQQGAPQQGGYTAASQPAYGAPQGYAPAQPAHQDYNQPAGFQPQKPVAPVQTQAPVQQPVDIGLDDPNDDLPF